MLVAADPTLPYHVGIDLGGTKTEVIVLDDSGGVLLRKRRPTPRGDYQSGLELIRALVHDADRVAGGPCPVGVGIPGSESPATGLIRNANSTWLNGRPLRADLEAVLGRPVRLANDANCFALCGNGVGDKCTPFALPVITRWGARGRVRHPVHAAHPFHLPLPAPPRHPHPFAPFESFVVEQTASPNAPSARGLLHPDGATSLETRNSPLETIPRRARMALRRGDGTP